MDEKLIEVSLESIEGRPVVMLPDGDSFEQTGELSSFLMRLGTLMPNCELPDKFIITTKAEIEQIRKDERERILYIGWAKFQKEIEGELDEKCFGKATEGKEG